MNAILNQTELWFCEICDTTNNIKSESKHTNSKSHKHKAKYGGVVKKNDNIKPDFDEVNYILNDTIKNCKNE